MPCSGRIGVVAITRETPASRTKVYAALIDPSVKVGTCVALVGEDEAVAAVGVITSIQTHTPIEKFDYAAFTALGTPPAQTRPTLITKAEIKIISPEGLNPGSAIYVRPLCPEDSETLWGIIPREKRILAGFLRGPGDEPVPAYYHSDYLLGPEGAHLNIGGKTGLATKTSYLKFLAYGILKWAEENRVNAKIIAFNVKRQDFLGLHNVREEAEVLKAIEDWGKSRGLRPDRIESYKKMYKNILDVVLSSASSKIKYFTYKGDPYDDQERFTGRGRELYKYGLWDLGMHGVLAGLFEEEDEASSLQVNLVIRALKVLNRRETLRGFGELLEDLQRCLGKHVDYCEKSPYREILAARPDSRTIAAVKRRLDGFMDRAAPILNPDSPSDNPIKADSLTSGINVIQLYGLDDVAKRVIVSAVVSEILREAEEKLRERRSDTVYVIIVDELNKYAPKGRSPIKEVLLEVAARGRDLRVALLGAEQFPSQIDPQILGNMGTLAMGRHSSSELGSDPYSPFRGLGEAVEDLDKGEILAYHPLYRSPLLLEFPPPVNILLGPA